MKIIAILAVCISLSGCGLFTKKPDASITTKVVHIDPRVLESCKDLVTISEPITFEGLLVSSVTNAELYLDCRNRQENSIKVIKEFSNIKEKP
jgi:hypothetical protein